MLYLLVVLGSGGGLKLIAIKFCLKEDEAGDRIICSS